METVNVHDAKTHFSRLLERVQAGETIFIAKAGKPIAKLSAIVATVRKPGALKHSIRSFDGADEPWPEQWLQEWQDGHDGDPLRSPEGDAPRAVARVRVPGPGPKR